MRMYDLIIKKKNGGELTREEIAWFVRGVCGGEIPDAQTAALLMAICLKGMGEREASDLTQEMLASGKTADLSAIPGKKADKHSTGGVGDSTTPVVAAAVAACGLKVAKMSGRALGHTGGTVDKFESLPGFRSDLSPQEFADVVNRVGAAVIAQTGELCPADKKLYALRDLTGTIDNVALIASSIMSKKLASGADVIMLDVKYGSGAFIKKPENALELADLMVRIGERAGRSVGAVVTSMDVPLGRAVGNLLEMYEAADLLCGKGEPDKRLVCRTLASGMLSLAGMGTREACGEMIDRAISSGRAFEKLCEMIRAQGGDPSMLGDPGRRVYAPYRREIRADGDCRGYLTGMDTEKIGITAGILGEARKRPEDKVDYTAGILIAKKTGDRVVPGDLLCELHTSDPSSLDEAERLYREALTFGAEAPGVPPILFAAVGSNGSVSRF